MNRKDDEPIRIKHVHDLGLDGERLVNNAFQTREPFIDRGKEKVTSRRLSLRTSAQNMQSNPTPAEKEAFRQLGITKKEDQIKMFASGILRDARAKRIPVDLQGFDEEEITGFVWSDFPGDKKQKTKPTPKEAPRGKPNKPRR